MRFILHEPYDLSWPLSGRSLGENMYYCASSIYFLKEKQIHHSIKFSFLFGPTDSLSQLDNDSIILFWNGLDM